MTSYQRRGDNSFLLVVEAGYDAKGKRKKRTRTIRIDDKALLKTKRKLENYLQKELVSFQMEVESSEYIAPEKRSFHEFARDWKEKYANKTLALRTRQNYEEKLKNYIIPYFGHKRISDIKPIHVVNFMDETSKPGAAKYAKKGLSDSSMYEIDKTLRVIFNKAVEWQVIKVSPMKDLSRPKIRKKEMNYLEPEEVGKLFYALESEPPAWRMYFLTATVGGLRRGEVIALQWSDIDFENGEIIVKYSIPTFEKGEPHIKSTKTDERSRHVTMPQWYMNELNQFKRKWLKERTQLSDIWEEDNYQFIFHSGTGRPYWPQTATGRWIKIKKKYYIKNIRLHDLRHTMVTLLMEEGESLKAIQERAGHSSSRITSDIYGHLTKKAKRSTADKFEKYDPNNFVDNFSTNRNPH
ncbi:site-specific integrase [Halobacillus shinanisalinarum]|uniref:Site-specific integrase n=1 Tax=Halobacillus shinanisalinarum TaxID=2932258 RepID=A0ABY4H4B8_9BACI|nr:site-specific integrase [Halobacillus shinanisalinarum]UOQ95146.1 site-specific integrase [Halobacillus shinanisalinarum]